MNLAFLKAWRKPLAILLVIVVPLVAALHYYVKANDEQQRADTAELKLALANYTIADMQMRQREVAALDARYTKELEDAKAENIALQRKLDRGGRVLVAGSCPKQPSTSPSVDDGAAIKLSSVAGRNVLNIRYGIRNDQIKIRALQKYIQETLVK